MSALRRAGRFRTGDRLGRFVVEDYLASGGMAEIYRARDGDSGDVVALKVVAAEAAHDRQFQTRFLRESALAAELRHPNIIPIVAAGDEDGVLFLAMHHIEAAPYPRPDLRAVLDAEGPLPTATVSAILAQVARGLDAAHDHGLVHRDVTPGNILLERGDGELDQAHVYLSDFGITRRAAGSSTRTDGFVGTLHYAAPEQIRNEQLDRRADIYALGCVVYVMLTGEVPFGGRDDVAAVVFAILEATPPPVTRLRPDLPTAVDAVLARAMAKDKSLRPPTAGQLSAQLRLALDPDATPPAVAITLPPRPPASAGRAPARARWLAGASAAVAVGAVSAALIWSPWSDDDGVAAGVSRSPASPTPAGSAIAPASAAPAPSAGASATPGPNASATSDPSPTAASGSTSTAGPTPSFTAATLTAAEQMQMRAICDDPQAWLDRLAPPEGQAAALQLTELAYSGRTPAPDTVEAYDSAAGEAFDAGRQAARDGDVEGWVDAQEQLCVRYQVANLLINTPQG